METESVILLAAAAACVTLLMLLRSAGSRLYNQSAGLGLVLIAFPTSLAVFSDVEWWVALVLAAVGGWLWIANPLEKP